MMQNRALPSGSGGTVLGFPLEGFGLFHQPAAGVCVGVLHFFCFDHCIAIFSLLVWNLSATTR